MNWPLVLAFLLSACGAEPKAWQVMNRSERVAALNSIADFCKVPRSIFDLREGDEHRLKSDPSEDYERVDCSLRKLKEVRGFQNMGFIGNEAYSNESF